MTKRYGLRDDQWDRIQEMLPGREGTVGVTARDNRLFVEALLYRYRAGIPWRDLPERFGDWKTSIAGSAAGLKPVCGRESFSISQRMLTMITPCSTARSCAHTNTALARKKSRRGSG